MTRPNKRIGPVWLDERLSVVQVISCRWLCQTAPVPKTAIIREPMTDMKILIADEVSDTGLQPLRAAGFLLEKKTKLSNDDLIVALQGCEGLVVRSETKVTADVLGASPDLRVVGRAGVGVDNIDVPAATARGIVVMNAPDGNTITTAEHTMALLIALARRVPQANSSLRSGKWERKSFVGVELQGKTLGIIGLGRIGRAVSSRATRVRNEHRRL